MSDLEVDPSLYNSDDSESAYDSGPESETTSLSSSVINYQYENGRRFHGYRSGKYHLPNDEREQDRLDLQAHINNLAFDGALFSAPIENPQSALDIGTGTGIWAIDFSEQFPECVVRGVDLSPIQPSFVPPNLIFEVDDAEEPWTWPPNSADYIHLRDMSYAVKNWDHIVCQAYKVLKPGGYLEIQDWVAFFQSDDGSVRPDCQLVQLQNALGDAVKKFGLPYEELMRDSEDLMKRHGFVDYQIKKKKIPFGPWAKDKKQKELGVYGRAWVKDTIDGTTDTVLARSLGWDLKKCSEMSRAAIATLWDKRVHSYHVFAHSYARKPLVE